MRSFGSIDCTETSAETPYISHSHRTCFPASSLPLLFVNQNCVVSAGSTNARNTSAGGLRINIAVCIGGFCDSSSFFNPPRIDGHPLLHAGNTTLFGANPSCSMSSATTSPFCSIANVTRDAASFAYSPNTGRNV